MSNTYAWFIRRMESYPQFDPGNGRGPLQNVVCRVSWARQGFDDNGNATEIPGEQDIEFSASDAFVPYSELKEADVIGWIEAALGADQVSALNAALDAKLAALSAPVVERLPLPWGNP
jgi:hypothetical protein